MKNRSTHLQISVMESLLDRMRRLVPHSEILALHASYATLTHRFRLAHVSLHETAILLEKYPY